MSRTDTGAAIKITLLKLHQLKSTIIENGGRNYYNNRLKD